MQEGPQCSCSNCHSPSTLFGSPPVHSLTTPSALSLVLCAAMLAVLPVSRIKAVCTSQAQNPPYKIVNCNVVNPFNVTVCLRLSCNVIVPGGCPTGPGAAGSSNEACAWNVKPPGTTMYPVQGGATWNFG